MAIVYLNGQYLPAEKATISVLDRGFIFGDGVYELIPCYNGSILRLQEHLQRLDNSLIAIRLKNPHVQQQWQQIIEQVMQKNGGGSLSIYLQVTRGVAPRDHALPAGIQPTVFIMAKPLTGISEDIVQNGTAAITLEDYRWLHCNIKAISLLPNVLMRQQAVDQGATEAILIRDGLITEGSSSNVFIVDDRQRLITPAKSQYLLPGITRDLILDLAKKLNLECLEQSINTEQLQQANEIWITSSLREVQAVTTLDGQVVGDGRPGPLWKKVYQALQDHKAQAKK